MLAGTCKIYICVYICTYSIVVTVGVIDNDNRKMKILDSAVKTDRTLKTFVLAVTVELLKITKKLFGGNET